MRHTDGEGSRFEENRVMTIEALKGEGSARARYSESVRGLVNSWRTLVFDDKPVYRRSRPPVEIVYVVEAVSLVIVVCVCAHRLHLPLSKVSGGHGEERLYSVQYASYHVVRRKTSSDERRRIIWPWYHYEIE